MTTHAIPTLRLGHGDSLQQEDSFFAFPLDLCYEMRTDHQRNVLLDWSASILICAHYCCYRFSTSDFELGKQLLGSLQDTCLLLSIGSPGYKSCFYVSIYCNLRQLC